MPRNEANPCILCPIRVFAIHPLFSSVLLRWLNTSKYLQYFAKDVSFCKKKLLMPSRILSLSTLEGYSSRKEFAPSGIKFFPLSVAPMRNMANIGISRVISLRNVSIHLKITVKMMHGLVRVPVVFIWQTLDWLYPERNIHPTTQNILQSKRYFMRSLQNLVHNFRDMMAFSNK